MCNRKGSSADYDDSTDENKLIVYKNNEIQNNETMKPTNTFKLSISWKNMTDAVPLQLNFLGTQSIADVKKVVSSLTNIAVQSQHWHGWPTDLSDDTTLALTGIPYDHNFILCLTEERASPSTEQIPMKEEQIAQRVRKSNADFLCETPEKTLKHDGCTTDSSNLNSIFPQNTPP